MYKSGADYRPKSLSLNFTRNTFGYTEQYTSQRSSSSSPPLPFPPSLYTHIRELPSLWIPAGASALFPIYGMVISLAPPLFWASPLQFHVTCKLLLSLLLKSISFIPRASMNEVYTLLIGNTFPKVFCAGERTFLPSLSFHSKIMIVRLTRWFELQICLDLLEFTSAVSGWLHVEPRRTKLLQFGLKLLTLNSSIFSG